MSRPPVHLDRYYHLPSTPMSLLTDIIQISREFTRLSLLLYQSVYYLWLSTLCMLTFGAYTVYHTAKFVAVASMAIANYLDSFMEPPAHKPTSYLREKHDGKKGKHSKRDTRFLESGVSSNTQKAGPKLLVTQGARFFNLYTKPVPSNKETFNLDDIFFVNSIYPAIKYGKGWEDFGDFYSTNTPNSTVIFPFNGVSVSWYAFTPQAPYIPSIGSYSIDGNDPIDFYVTGASKDSNVQDPFSRKLFETPQSEPGRHELVVTYLGNSSTTPLTLDRLVVQNATGINETYLPLYGNPKEWTVLNHSRVGLIWGGVVIGWFILIGVAFTLFHIFYRRKQKSKKKQLYEISAD